MTIVITNIFTSPKCPKYLQPIGVEFAKGVRYAFTEESELARFADGCRQQVKALASTRKASVRFDHVDTLDGGSIIIGKNDLQTCDYLRMSYIKVRGHVHVSKDGQKLYPQDFIKEGETA